jgi:hypothetical protein
MQFHRRGFFGVAAAFFAARFAPKGAPDVAQAEPAISPFLDLPAPPIYSPAYYRTSNAGITFKLPVRFLAAAPPALQYCHCGARADAPPHEHWDSPEPAPESLLAERASGERTRDDEIEASYYRNVAVSREAQRTPCQWTCLSN